MIRVGLVGNPNAGKSTIFNALTGARQHVGNWPGKTVERKEGLLSIDGREIMLVDLPGTYSLTPYSVEELIARDFIVEDAPQAIVCIVDAANLERNLYLVVQVLEMGVPVVLALNMSDIAAQRGITIDAGRLSARLGGIPIIPTTGSRSIGLDALKAAIARTAGQPGQIRSIPGADLGEPLGGEIDRLRRLIAEDKSLSRYPARWMAIKLLEGDSEVRASIAHNPALGAAVDAASARITEKTGDDPDTLIADARYGFIGQVVREAVTRPAVEPVTTSDRLDRVLTHRLWGLPIFLLLMWIVFQVTANVSAPLLDFTDGLIGGTLSTWVANLLNGLGLGGTWFAALLVDGIIAGVGGVLVFVPVLMFLYLSIAILEDSGYMARAAFVMDRLMSRLGLHGKSFLPMLVGFGCTVPAVYATRTLENERDRKLTAFLATFMSCGARLPVYALFGAAFFGAAGGNLIFAMYVTGIAIAVLTSLLFTRLIFRNKPTPPFVMELPPYRIPNAHTVALSTWERTMGFVRKAGTTILAASIVIWLLLAIPARAGSGGFNAVPARDSLFGVVSGAIAPVFTPAGFGDWQASGALVTGFLAKEVIVATMSQVYEVEEAAGAEAEPTTLLDDLGGVATSLGEALILTAQETVNIIPRTVNLIPGVAMPEANFLGVAAEEEDLSGLEAALAGTFTPLSAVAFCVFVLLYVPCMAASAAMRHEFGARWGLLQMGYTLGIAWLAAVLVFQVGGLLGLGG